MRAKAKVVGNTLVLEENLALPEGAEVDLVLRVVGDHAGGWDVSDEAWAELEASMEEAERGELIPAEAVLAELRAAK